MKQEFRVLQGSTGQAVWWGQTLTALSSHSRFAPQSIAFFQLVNTRCMDSTRAYVKRRGPRRKGACEYGCNYFVTLPHGSKPVSSGKGNSHINNYYASSYSSCYVCGKLAYLLSEDSSCSWHCASHSLWEASLCM